MATTIWAPGSLSRDVESPAVSLSMHPTKRQMFRRQGAVFGFLSRPPLRLLSIRSRIHRLFRALAGDLHGLYLEVDTLA
jgi:hypothetical protein